MKTIGLIGGMSWESTQSYYRIINEAVKAKLGGQHSAKLCLYSVDFAEIEVLQHQGKWAETAEILGDAALSLEKAGADFVMICTNTMHKVAPEIEAKLAIPMLHIADATAQRLQHDEITKVGLLGTRFTMEQDFYKGRITDRFGIDVVVPERDDQTIIHDIIYTELCLGLIKPESKHAYLKIINKLAEQGAQAIILGCTEIALLVQQADTDIRLYDTTEIHAMSGVGYALASE
ncbi:aspartate/glutamate racemase family protein [Vibrio viridaestus]|uniref:Aspartate/glutamate racemase family protein n=1 Tax=Vibrio viridaestus TaxID=2487322 RepID=A0A3N9TFX7_9VIBR|nr:aspartate/glutamate racemase family protein [Vibrio viridaestus]RQW62653.1 aspartate/glutamate racemase family protein [Vibrio viridaestus]